MTSHSGQLAITVGSPGDLSSVALRPAQRRPPSPGEIEIEVEAASLNFKDILLALGLLDASPTAVGSLGSECAGVVASIGAGVSGFSIGEPVVALGRGCLARYVVVPAAAAARKPERLDVVEAATVPAALVTADYSLLELGRLRRGERILIHAAAGGVGLAAVQIASRIGADIYATAGHDTKRAFLSNLGVLHVMDSRSLAFAEQLMEATSGRGVDVVLNALSGAFIERSLSVLSPGGRMIELGVRDVMANTPLGMGLFRAGISLSVVSDLGVLPGTSERLQRLLGEIARGELSPLPYQVFRASEAASAFSHLAGARHIGKVVITWSNAHYSSTVLIPRDFARVCRGQAAEKSPNPLQASRADYILPSEGPDIFERAVASGFSQVVISTTNLAARLGKGVLDHVESPLPGATAKGPVYRRPPIRTAMVPPRGGQEEALAAQWRAALGLDEVGIHDDFFELGGDSLLAVQVLAQARKELGVDLPPHSLVEAPTIAKLALRIATARPTAERPLPETLVCLRKGRGWPPLILFHPIGGHVYIYRELAALLPEAQPVYGVQARALGSGEAAPTIPALADSYLEDVLTLQAEGPYLLGGSSFGAMLAYEIARRLVERGRGVPLLAMLDAPGPGYMPTLFEDDAGILGYLLARRKPTPNELSQLRARSHNDRIAYFIECGRSRPSSMPMESIAEVESMLTRWRASQEALQTYAPSPYPGRVLFFSAMEADGVNAEQPDRAWRDLARGGLDVHRIPGSHITMNYPPNVAIIAEILSVEIARALGMTENRADSPLEK